MGLGQAGKAVALSSVIYQMFLILFKISPSFTFLFYEIKKKIPATLHIVWEISWILILWLVKDISPKP